MAAETFRSPSYRILSALLHYPDDYFPSVLDDSRAFFLSSSARGVEDVCEILEVIEWMRSQPLLRLQQRYVETFDLSPKHSLHLTFHLLEEQDRRRGPALIKLARHYKAAGLYLGGGELPDYLPAILEYASTLDGEDAASFLREADEALELLERNLRAVNTPYAALVSAARAQAKSQERRAPEVTGERSL